MIPPLPQTRLRSIQSWLQSNPDRTEPLSPAELLRKTHSLDEQMMEAFDTRTSELQSRMMEQKDWGTEQATAAYRTAELETWQEIVSEFLPETTEPQPEA